MERQYVTFELNREEYGVDIKNVREITDFKDYTKIPDAPKFLLGVVNIRGAVIPVIDLKQRFKLPSEVEQGNKKTIIVNLEEREIGFMIDNALRVITLGDEQVEPPPELILDGNSGFVTGVGKIDDKLILILDLKGILTSGEREQIFKAQKDGQSMPKI